MVTFKVQRLKCAHSCLCIVWPTAVHNNSQQCKTSSCNDGKTKSILKSEILLANMTYDDNKWPQSTLNSFWNIQQL